MARKLRLQFPGAIYHLMSRGNRREPIFREDPDRELFLRTLQETCAKTGWRVHAFCLLPDHFHLVVETPQANLVAGMKWFLGTYTSRFNRRHQICGHVFSGRYRSSLIGPSGGFLRTVCAYVHLNPIRAGLLEVGARLESYRWSSFPQYVAPLDESPSWVERSRVLRECEIQSDSPNAGELYGRLLAQEPSFSLKDQFVSIRTGWLFGSDAYRGEVLSRIQEKASSAHYGSELQEASEAKARSIIEQELRQALWNHAELLQRRKGDPWKIALAQRLRAETTVTLQWITSQLHMGTRTHLSHLLYWSKRAMSHSANSMRKFKAQRNEKERLRTKPRVQTSVQTARGISDLRQPHLDAENSPHTILSTDPVPFEFDTRFD